MYAGGLNVSPLYECISHIHLYRLFVFAPLLMIDKKGEKNFEILYMHVCIFVYAYMFVFCLCTLMNILITYFYAWVKGELLWSLTLIHAYITPWVLSSSKWGRLLAQRPFTLWLTHVAIVLMILCLISFRFVIKILVGV